MMIKINKRCITLIYEKVLSYGYKIKIINDKWYIIDPTTGQRFKCDGKRIIGKARYDNAYRAYGHATEMMEKLQHKFYIWNCNICNGWHISRKSGSGRIEVKRE